IGESRRVDHVNASAGSLEMHQGRAQRMLVALFDRIEITDRRAALDTAGRLNSARLGEQRFSERRLARRAVTYQRYGTNVLGGELRHGPSSMQSIIDIRGAAARRVGRASVGFQISNGDIRASDPWCATANPKR